MQNLPCRNSMLLRFNVELDLAEFKKLRIFFLRDAGAIVDSLYVGPKGA